MSGGRAPVGAAEGSPRQRRGQDAGNNSFAAPAGAEENGIAFRLFRPYRGWDVGWPSLPRRCRGLLSTAPAGAASEPARSSEEAADILPFFKDNKHLTAYIDTLYLAGICSVRFPSFPFRSFLHSCGELE